MHLAVHGLTNACCSWASSNCFGKALVAAPVGAIASTIGMGAPRARNLSTIGFSAGSATLIVIESARSLIFAIAA